MQLHKAEQRAVEKHDMQEAHFDHCAVVSSHSSKRSSHRFVRAALQFHLSCMQSITHTKLAHPKACEEQSSST